MKNYKMLYTLLVIVIMAACKPATETYENPEAMINAAKEATTSISAEELSKLIAEQPAQIQIIDCREQADYMAGHIASAVNVPRGLLEFSSKLSNRRLKTIVFGNGQGSAALAVKSLKPLKYCDVCWVDTSWDDWANQHPDLVETGMPGNEPVVVAPASSGGCGG